MIALVILATVLATAVLSGLIGMAGGLLLMAVLVTLLPLASAMILHGAVQAFVSLALVPDPAVVLILVGCFPWLARLLPARMALDVRRPFTGAACGATVTAAQLLAGASGPLLDAFYQHTEVDRHCIVATKAFTQAAGHIIKIGYYAWVAAAVLDEFSIPGLSIWLVGASIMLAIIGARVGTRLLEKLDDRQFRRLTGWVILGLGALCILKGMRDLLSP